MQRRPAQSRWADVVWEPHGVVPGYAGSERKLLLEQEGVGQWLHPGFKLELHRDETEGYYLNVVGLEPRVFVLWRMRAMKGRRAEARGAGKKPAVGSMAAMPSTGCRCRPRSMRGWATTWRGTIARSRRSASSRALSSTRRIACSGARQRTFSRALVAPEARDAGGETG